MEISFKKYFIKIANSQNRKAILIVFLVALIISSLLIIFSLKNEPSEPKKPEKPLVIGIISDIHAGSQDIRKNENVNNTIFPSHFEKNLRMALENMQDCDFILTLGDNLNNSSKKYTDQLKQITSGYPMIWTKGNHEDDKTFKLFSPTNYYYVDKNNWRIIVLDNGNIDHEREKEKADPRGYMEPEQIAWLRNVLETKKNILISMHVPIFSESNPDFIYPDQEDLVEIFENSKNVKYVLAGHHHMNNWHKQINGIDYYIIPALSLEDKEGHYVKLELK